MCPITSVTSMPCMVRDICRDVIVVTCENDRCLTDINDEPTAPDGE
jgi:hypothetical protein